jgi:hypothetical protein
MKPAWRRDLAFYLDNFVASHPGMRFGWMFGWPAAYAGRHLFSLAVDDGIIAKLPAYSMAAATAQGAKRWTPRRRRPARRTKGPTDGWMIFRPKDLRAAEAVAPFLEIAARHVSDRS